MKYIAYVIGGIFAIIAGVSMYNNYKNSKNSGTVQQNVPVVPVDNSGAVTSQDVQTALKSLAKLVSDVQSSLPTSNGQTVN